MLVYLVEWWHDSTLAKGKGRASDKDIHTCFTVLCRTQRDALACLQYHFYKSFSGSTKFDIDDGCVQIQRFTIDSRGFNVHYLLMDGMKEPLTMSDLKDNCNRLHKIFGVGLTY